jgi:hypothetical protein
MSHMRTRLKAKDTPPSASGSTLSSGNNLGVPKEVPEEPPDPTPTPESPQSAANPAAPPPSSFPFLSPTPPSITPEWAQQALEYAESLWDMIDKNIRPIDNSPEAAKSIKVLSDIRQLMERTNRTIGSALSGIPALNQPAITNTEEPVLKAIRDLSDRMRAQEATIQRLERATTTHNKPDSTTPSTAPTPSPNHNSSPTTNSKPTYSQQAAKPPPPNTAKATKPPNNKQSPPVLPPLLRYIVRFRGNPPAPEKRWSSERATKKVNTAFEGHPATKGKLRAIAATSRPNGNYVVVFSTDSCPRIAEENKEVISKALAPDHPDVLVTKDELWARVVIHKITRLDDTLQPRTTASLAEAILDNPVLKGVQITHQPSWVHSEEKLKDMHASAISFAFIEKPDPILPRLLREPFYMFGAPVRVERWQEKLRPTQCKKCWRLTHFVKQCRSINPRCRKCGKLGNEDQHRAHCEECKKTPDAPAECPHISCLNCHANNHCADDPKCPSKLALASKQKPPPTVTPTHRPPNPITTQQQ